MEIHATVTLNASQGIVTIKDCVILQKRTGLC
jgi:hypothetical protein